jgi:hypothetical protein
MHRNIYIPVIVLLDDSSSQDCNDMTQLLPQKCIFHKTTVMPPNATDLIQSIESILIQPRGYGGSSGFGTKLSDPIRCPYHTVHL